MSESIRKGSNLIIAAIRNALESGTLAVLATIIEAPIGVGSKLLITESGETTGDLGDVSLSTAVIGFAASFLESREEARTFRVAEFAPELGAQADTKIFFERIQPEPRIVICGAGHVGAALAKLASFAGYRTTLIDDRPEFVTRERFPDQLIELLAADGWAEGVRKAIGTGAGVSVAIVTRGHTEDEECLRSVMATDPDYVGLIGSKRRTNIVLDRLRATGIDESKLMKVRAPVGLDIGAVTPEEVALAILAEIVAERRGGEGGSLSAWRRKDVQSPKSKV
jgi:xanthine dehydrogenase accessory factor